MTWLAVLPISTPPHIAILGAGISGLAAAWHLHRDGLAVTVFETAPRVGGAIGSLRSGGWLHELGPNSLLESTPEVAEFVTAAGLGARRIYSSPAAGNRYIVREGRPVRMPASPGSFLTTPLFSLRAKVALLGEPFRARAPADREESVADFVIRRLGREFLDYAVNPFVGGVYAGDPRRLSVRDGFPKLHALEQKHGSLIRGAIARRNTSGGPAGRMFSFAEGLEELPRALAQALGPAVRLQTRVRAFRPQGRSWELESEGGGGTRRELFSAVVCALPADALAALDFSGAPRPGGLKGLGEIEHPPVASVFTGYRRGEVAHALDGFGVLVPEVERGRILGTLFSSSLFAGRAPDGYVALTSFVGGTRQPGLARLDDAELLHVVQEELVKLVGVKRDPVYTHIQRWPRAIPQYTLGYRRHQEAMAAFEQSAPGLFIGGNCRDGISLANCIGAGRRLARTAGDYVRQTAGA